MKKGIIGKKIGMTQIFDESGKVIPVTVVEAGPCAVVQKKTVENDGYSAVQLGFSDAKATRVNKPQQGHFAERLASLPKTRASKSFRLEDDIDSAERWRPRQSGHLSQTASTLT